MSGFLNSRIFRVYNIPGAVFQSVIVGGGHGTGRDGVEGGGDLDKDIGTWMFRDEENRPWRCF